MSDIIFWYTGWIAWAGIGVIAVIVVVCALVVIYNNAKKWDMFWRLFSCSEEKRQAILAGFDAIDFQYDEKVDQLIRDAARAMRKHLKRQEAFKHDGKPPFSDYSHNHLCTLTNGRLSFHGYSAAREYTIVDIYERNGLKMFTIEPQDDDGEHDEDSYSIVNVLPQDIDPVYKCDE